MSNNWPTAPLIKVVRGKEYDEPVRDALAARSKDDEYLLATGPRAGNSILRKAPSDDIDDWEEVTAVPTAALEEFKEAWKGFGMYDADGSQRVTDAITSILACLPANKPSALDQAVTRVKDADGRFLHRSHTPPERLAILLDEIASVLDKRTRKDSLHSVTRLCVEWANDVQPTVDALKRAKQMAESEEQAWHPESDEERYRGMAICAGQVSAGMGDTDTGLREALCLTAGRALAWAAEIIEEEGK